MRRAPSRSATPARSNRIRGAHSARASVLVLVAVLLLGACSTTPPDTGPIGVMLEPGGAAAGPDGTWLAAPPDALEASIEVFIERTADPSGDVPLPGGAVPRSAAWRVSASDHHGVSASHPLVLLIPVPEGADLSHLALAVFEEDQVFAPPDEDSEGGLAPSWVYVDTVVQDDFIVAPILGLDPTGWTAMVVEHPVFDSRPAVDGTSVWPSSTGFVGVCDPGFDDGPETCDEPLRDAAAAALQGAYDDLTSLGYTDDPRLSRATGTAEISFGSGFVVVWSYTPGPYRIALRPVSSITNNAGGMYSTSSGNIWVAVGTDGLTAHRERTVRHEYVHATQYGYDPVFGTGQWLPSRWVIEGQAVVLESSFETLTRANGRSPREVDITLRRSRWDGQSFGDEPSSEYQAQDFWFYLAQRFDGGLAFFVPFMEEGMRATEVDTVLRRDFPAFSASGYDGGLPRAYWDWVRNQVFEKQVDMTSDGWFGNPCTFNTRSATPIITSFDPAAPPSDQTTIIDPLTTYVYRVDFPASGDAGYGTTMRVASDSEAVRSVFFRQGIGADCALVPDAGSRTVTVDGGTQRYFVLVANTDLSAEATTTFSFEGSRTIVIDEPQDGATLPAGPVSYRATISDGQGDVFWRIEGIDSDFLWTPTTGSGESGSVVLCDGTYSITASVTGSGGGAHPSTSHTITVTDAGAGSHPSCQPDVSILLPIDGGTYTTGTAVALRADPRSAGVATYPVQWRIGSPDAAVIATGAEAGHTFGAGQVALYVTYGSAVDSVSFTVLDDPRDPPTAGIFVPEDGASFPWFDDTAGVGGAGHTIGFFGLGSSAEDGLLPAAQLRWYTRRTDGSPTPFVFRGTGPTIDLFFGWASCTWQTYDVQLQVTDSVGLVGTAIHSISIQPPIC